MIEIKINENGVLTNASGNVIEITAEVAYAVGDIYLGISSESKECAQYFRSKMQRLMADDSPVWADYGEEENAVKALLIDTDRKVCEIDVENTLEALQARVGGYIQTVYLNNGLIAICNEDGKLEELPPVALLLSPDGSIAYDALCGPVVVCRADGEEFTGIQPGDEKSMRRSLFVLPAVRGVAVG